MTAKIDAIARDVENAQVEFDTGLASLRTTDGRAVFAPEEEARRRAEIQTTYRQAQSAAQKAVQVVIADAEKEIAASGVADPLTRLLPTELERAAALRGFLADDYERLPVSTLVQRAREALEGDDKALRALHLRYGRQIATERPTESYELREVLDALENTVTNVAQRDAAQKTIDAANQFTVSMATSSYIEKTYGSMRPSRVA